MTIPPDLDILDFFGRTEDSVRRQTLAQFTQVHEDMCRAVDLLIKQGEFINENVNPDSEAGVFQFVASSAYYRSPYTILSIDYLWLRGYYTEAMVLVRHLYEGYATARYFHDHRDRIMAHLTATRARDRVSFVDMFNHISPGFYRRFYSQMSGFAHGGAIAAAMRMTYQTAGTPGTVTVGLEFRAERASVVGEYFTLNIIYALLAHAALFFPTHRNRLYSELQDDLDQLQARIRARIDSPRAHADFETEHQDIMVPFLTR